MTYNNESYVISFDALYDSMLKCKRGVSWKSSVAHFTNNAVEEVYKLATQLQSGTYKERPQRSFKLYRPKERDIVSISFRDRVYQRSLNDNVIYPSIQPHLIYDNCSCQKGKGTQFALDRMRVHLHRYYRKNGAKGYVLQCDIKKYYPSMRHDVAKRVFRKYLDDTHYRMACEILDTFKGDVGFNPGSQIIQIAGISVLSELDHIIKEKFHIEQYIRYMDDFILISKDREKLEQIRNYIEAYLIDIGFKLHNDKTEIFPLSDGILFLGFEYKLTSSGKVLCFVNPKKIKNDRREIKKMAKLVKQGKMKKSQYYQSYQCRRSHYEYGDSNKLLFRMDKYVKEQLK